MTKHVVLLKSRATHAGGLEKSASRIVSAFVEKGARVSVLTTGDTPPNLPSVSFFATKTWAWPSFRRIEQFDQFVQDWIQKNPADLIFGMDRNREQTHIRAGNGVHDAYLQSRTFTEGKWKEFTCRFNPMHRKILEIERISFESSKLKKLFTNSYMVREQILQRYSVDPHKIEVIHNGVEWHEMEEDFAVWPLKKPSEEPFHFLFIGNGYLRKGLKQLLLGLSLLPHRDFILSVIGKDRRMQEYVSLAKRIGLSKRIRFLGAQADIRPFYQRADALVIPSFYDPFANVTIEALAMGLFVISSRYNGGCEILTPQNGLIIEDLLDPDAMAQALSIALGKKKTVESAIASRESVKHLDFSKQLHLLTKACLE